jgi:hypothetical protein
MVRWTEDPMARLERYHVGICATRFHRSRIGSGLYALRTARAECLDRRLVLGHQRLQRLIAEYVAYYNEWRAHRGLDQTAPCQQFNSDNSARSMQAGGSWLPRSLAGCIMPIDSRPNRIGGSDLYALQPRAKSPLQRGAPQLHHCALHLRGGGA